MKTLIFDQSSNFKALLSLDKNMQSQMAAVAAMRAKQWQEALDILLEGKNTREAC